MGSLVVLAGPDKTVCEDSVVLLGESFASGVLIEFPGDELLRSGWGVKPHVGGNEIIPIVERWVVARLRASVVCLRGGTGLRPVATRLTLLSVAELTLTFGPLRQSLFTGFRSGLVRVLRRHNTSIRLLIVIIPRRAETHILIVHDISTEILRRAPVLLRN